MPVADKYGKPINFPMSKDGVYLHKNLLDLTPTEAFQTQNCLWINGMVKRGGQSLVTATEVVTNKKITGLHKFYKSDGSSQLLASADTLVKKLSGGAWTSIGVTQTTGLQTYFTTWGALNKVYICNGTNDMRSWDGSTAATLTLPDGGAPTQALPYQDRLLTIQGGNLTWSASFDDTVGNWGKAVDIGVKPDTVLYGMCYHSVSNSSTGSGTSILLAGSNGMYLFSATDLRWPSTTGDYQIQQLALPVGCNAPRTMVWTPYGTIWLGIDKQLYGLPFGSVTPIMLGTKITSVLNSGLLNISGIEAVPITQTANACAAYSSNGYYILSIAGSNQSVKNTQWWLDIRRLSQDGDGNWGPWYGPMTGQTISCFFSQTGNGDGGELIAGENTAKGYVYQVSQDGVYGDINPADGTVAPIPVVWQTPYNILSDPLRSDVHKMEAQLLGTSGQINVDFLDIDQMLRTGDYFDPGGTQTFWNDVYWDEAYWSNAAPTRQVIDISPAIQPRRLSLVFRQNVSNDKFELYSAVVETIEQSQVFA